MIGTERRTAWALSLLLGCLLAACGSEDTSSADKFESDLPTRNQGGGSETSTSAGAESSASASDSDSGREAERAIVEADIIQLAGNRLYALSRIAGLSVVDISNPAKLALLGRYRNISGEPFEMYVRRAQGEDVLLAMFSSWGSYVADGDDYRYVQTSKLVALDVSNPASIEKLSSFDVAGAISDSRMVGDVLYVVGYQDGYCWRCTANTPQTSVLSLDVKDARNVHRADELNFADQTNSWGWNRRSVTVTDQRLYVAGPEYGDNGPVGSSIQVVDISDPSGDLVEGAVIKAVGQVSSRWQMDEYQGVLRVVSQPGSWSTSQHDPVVQTFTVSSSSQVTPLGQLNLKMPQQNEVLQSARFDGPRAYAITAERRDPLFIIDLSRPESPRQRGELHMPGFVYHMEPRGNRVIGLGFDQGNPEGGIAVSVFDVTNMDAPSMLSRVNFGGTWANLPEDQDRIHKAFRILDEQGLVLVPFSGWSDVSAADPKSCASAYRSGVQLLDLAGDTLSLRGVAPSVGEARRAFIHGSHLFSVSDQRVESFDISDRSSPAAVGSLAMARYVRQVVPLANGLVARINANYWADSPFVDIVAAADVGTPQLSLGELAIGDAIAGDADCRPYSYIEAAFGEGSQLEILYHRYSQAPYDGGETAGVLTIDASEPSAPRLMGKVEWTMREPASQGSYSWFNNFYDYGVYNPARSTFARAGGLLLMLEASYDERAHDDRPTLRLRAVDISDPSQPRTSTLQLPDRLYSGFVSSGEDVLLGFHQQTSAARASFFVQSVDLTDPAELALGKAINVPGALMHYDAAHQRLLTSELARVAGGRSSWQDCQKRFGYYQFEWANDGSQLGSCIGYQQTLQLVKLGSQTARIEDSLVLDEAQVVTSSALGDDRITAALGKYAGYFGGIAIDCWGPCGPAAVTAEPTQVLTLSGLASGKLAHGTLTVETSTEPWWGWWGATLPVYASGHSALLTSYDDFALIDVSDVEAPKLISTQALFGSVEHVSFQDGSAFVSLGQGGAQRIALP